MIGRYRDGVVPDAARRRAGRRSSTAWPRTVCERLDAVEITPALDEIWRRIKLLNRYVPGRGAVAARQGRGAGRAARRGPLRAGRGPAGGLACCCIRSCPTRRSGCSAALGREDLLARRARASARSAAARSSASSASSSRASRPSAGRLRRPWSTPTATSMLRAAGRGARRAGARGRGRADRHGRHGRGIDRAGARGGARARRACSRSSGATRTRPTGFGRRRARGDRARRGRPARARDRRDGARLLPRLRAARRPAARVRGAARAGRAGQAAAS